MSCSPPFERSEQEEAGNLSGGERQILTIARALMGVRSYSSSMSQLKG